MAVLYTYIYRLNILDQLKDSYNPLQLAAVAAPAMIDRVWTSASAGSGSQGADMPDYSFTPQEYITQVHFHIEVFVRYLCIINL
jgi:hypothetical protein